MVDAVLLASIGRSAAGRGTSLATEMRRVLDEHYNGRCEVCGYPARNGRLCHGCSWMRDSANEEWTR